MVNFHYASAAGLQALRIPILSGRPWPAARKLPPLMAGPGKPRSAAQAAQAPVLISASLAREFWPGQSALGKTLWLPYGGGGAAKVIGVVGDIHEASRLLAATPTIYVSVRQDPEPTQLTFAVQTRRGTREAFFAPAARSALECLPFQIARPGVTSLSAKVQGETRALSLALWAIGAFAFLALVVGGLGVYASARQLSATRTREVGIRLALGAGRGGIIRLMLLRDLKMLALALPAGTIGALILAHALRHWFFHLGATSVAIYAGAWAILIAVALAAALGPVLRGTRCNPAALLHDQ